jgi:short-subunit dehydrogenase
VELPGAVVVVTGATRGIGAATADLLTRAGATVVRVGRTADALDELALDVRDPDAAERIVAHALERHGRLDAVVANAGIGFAGALQDMTAARVADLVATNLTAPVQLARCALPHVQALLFVTSIAGALGVPGESVYSATKAGLETFAETLREEARGVAVSTVLPGVVRTGFFADRGRPYDRRVPRPMTPEQAAAVVVAALRSGRPRVVAPRWLAVPARLHAVAPRLYRALERRFG